MRRVLALLVTLAACRSAPAKPEGGDVMIPKMPADAATGSVTTDASGSGPVTGGGTQGWYLDGEQMQPQYVDRSVIIAALRRAPQRIVATIDEKIEECSSAGGTHVLFKTSAPVLHFGGHGTMLHVGLDKGSVWVAGYDALPGPESIKNDGFCVPERKIEGRITVLLPVKDKDEGAKVLDELAR